VVRRLKLRWILPVLMTLANLSLLAISMSHGPGTRTALQRPDRAGYENVALQDDETLSFKPSEPPRASWELKTAVALNLPAVFLGGIIAAILHRSSDSAVIGFASFFVPILWNRIGLWIDRQIGVAAPGKWPRLSSALCFLLGALAGVIFIVMVLSAAFEARHLDGERMFISAALFVWSGTYLAFSFWGARRKRLGKIPVVLQESSS